MSAQTCDRIITGRNFDYASALNIIQSETYLEQEDLNEIGLYHRQGEVLEAIEKLRSRLNEGCPPDLLKNSLTNQDRAKISC